MRVRFVLPAVCSGRALCLLAAIGYGSHQVAAGRQRAVGRYHGASSSVDAVGLGGSSAGAVTGYAELAVTLLVRAAGALRSRTRCDLYDVHRQAAVAASGSVDAAH